MSLKDKITLAYYLEANYGRALLQDKEIHDLLAQLNERIDTTWKEMASIGVIKECTDCALNAGGSCCGSGMERWYSEILLLINLLLGRSLPENASEANSCHFLSERGCTLRAREVLCVNYLCQRIYKSIQYGKLIQLQKIAGEELITLFILQECIKKKIKQLSNSDWRKD